MSNKNLSYCAEIVKRHDPDRFLLSLFAPADAREALWALFAFNHEIAKTREIVSEPALGEIRLQWWLDELDKIYDHGATPSHEILAPLATAIRQHDLPREYFETLIDVRRFDLEDTQSVNLDALLHYADLSGTPLLRLALNICGDDPDLEPVEPIALNYALIGLLRSIPFQAAQGYCHLPEEMMKTHDISLDDVYAQKSSAALCNLVQEIDAIFVKPVKSNNIMLESFQRLAMMQRTRLRRCRFDPFAPRMIIPPPFKALRLSFAALKQRPQKRISES